MKKKLLSIFVRLSEQKPRLINGLISLFLLSFVCPSGIALANNAYHPRIIKLERVNRADIKVSGTIKDKNTGETLIGVTVTIKGTTRGVITDAKGEFTIEAPENGTLVISYVSYQTLEVPINGQSQIDVTLSASNKDLNEVVVIGYGSAKKSDLTGSVSSLTEKDFNKGVNNNVDQIMQGKIAGVNIQQTNAQPGGITNIQIRGINSLNASNSPLYVIDGMPIDNSVVNSNNVSATFSPAPPNPLASINPSDIASIEVLKDASSTAIYGNRGSNGVILITTKNGQKGKTQVSYNGSVGFQKVANHYDLMDASQYANFHNQYYDFYASQQPSATILTQATKYSAADLARFNAGGGTDWFNLLTRNGMVDNQQVSVSGGSDNATYYAAVNYQNQSGVVKFSDLNRVSGRLNTVQKIGKSTEFGLNLTASNVKTNNVPVGTGIAGNSRGGALNGALYWAPTISPYAADGTINLHPFNPTNSNPAALSLVNNVTEETRQLATTYLKVNISDKLFVKETIGYDNAISTNRAFVPQEAKNSLASTGEASQSTFQNKNVLSSALINYKDRFGKNGLDLTAASDYQYFDYTGFYGRATGFSTSSFSYNNMAAGQTQYTGSSRSSNTLLSFLGRANYNYDEKYLLTLSARYDGSSKFAEGNKWGFFPSAAFAWRLINESFVKNMNVFDDLKFRVSYGKTGNQSINNNNSQPLLGTTGITPGVIGGTKVNPIAPIVPGNSDLTWEKTGQFDIGLDFAFFNSRLRGGLDYYHTVTKDLLLSFNLPSTSGFTSVVRNAGATENKGVELSLSSDNIKGNAFTWTTDFNISYNKNAWKDRAGLPFAPQNEFGPINGIYGYIVDGIWQQNDNISGSSQPNSKPGQYRFRDIKGRDANNNIVNSADGKLTSDDVTLLGQSTPKSTAGLTNTFGYKNFRLTVFLQGQFGFKIYNGAQALLNNPYNTLILGGVGTAAANYWTPTNTNTMIASGVPNTYGSDYNSVNIQSGDFVRLKTVNLSYTLPFKASWYKSFNVYINCDNLLLITKYKGLDPESAIPAYNSSGSEIDVYPPARTFVLGVNVNF